MLSLHGDESYVRLDSTDNPEFDTWRWVAYWLPIKEIVAFKRKVYEQALREFAPLISAAGYNPSRLSDNTDYESGYGAGHGSGSGRNLLES